MKYFLNSQKFLNSRNSRTLECKEMLCLIDKAEPKALSTYLYCIFSSFAIDSIYVSISAIDDFAPTTNYNRM